MGVRVLIGVDDGGEGSDAACLYDSTTGWVFGPLFTGVEDHEYLIAAGEEAEGFLAWVQGDHLQCEKVYRGGDDADLEESPSEDPRKIDAEELERHFGVWRRLRRAEAEGEATDGQ